MSRYSDAVLALSPLLYWRLGDAMVIGEAGATYPAATDLSGNGRHGTLSGTMELGRPSLIRTDLDDTAYGFDASGGEITTPQLQLTQHTMAIWYRRDGLSAGASTGYHQLFMRIMGTTGNLYAHDLGYVLYQGLDSGGATANYFAGGSSAYRPFAADGSMHFVVATYDGTTMRVYIDGEEQGSGLAVTLQSPTTTSVSQVARIASYTLNGVIDEAAVWNVALTATQIKRLFRAGAAFDHSLRWNIGGLGTKQFSLPFDVLRDPLLVNFAVRLDVADVVEAKIRLPFDVQGPLSSRFTLPFDVIDTDGQEARTPTTGLHVPEGYLPSPYAAAVLDLNPIGYWRLGEPADVDPDSVPNIMNNGSFSAGLTGWIAPTPTQTVIDPVGGRFGGKALHWSGADNYLYAYQQPTFVAGKTYRLSFWMRATADWSTGGGGSGMVLEQSEGPADTVRLLVTGTGTVPTEWTHYTATWTQPTTKVRNVLATNAYGGSSSGGGVWIDDVHVSEVGARPSARDSSRWLRHGAYEGPVSAAGLLTADSDGAAIFDGVDDRVHIAHRFGLSDRTYAAIVRPDVDAQMNIFGYSGTGNLTREAGGAVRVWWYNGAGVGVAMTAPGNRLPVGETHHVVGTVTPDGRGQVFIDGALAIESDPVGVTVDPNVAQRIGLYYNDIRPWNGVIDEVAIWDRALSAEEVAALYFIGTQVDEVPA